MQITGRFYRPYVLPQLYFKSVGSMESNKNKIKYKNHKGKNMSNKDLEGATPIDKTKIKNAKLDIVFIHGLKGHAADSWINKKKEFWPSWLHDDFTNDVCVWTVGYDAAPIKWFWGTTMPLQDRSRNILEGLQLKGIGKRPVIFVVHSMGGLVTKYMLSYASDHEVYTEILNQTKSILFLGVPHNGATLATWAKAFDFALQPNEITNHLASDNPYLRDLKDRFESLLKRKPIDCLAFFETLPLLELGKIVSESSASAVTAIKPAIGIDANHLSICKIDDKEQSLVYGNLQLSIENALKEGTPSDEPSSTPQKTQTSKLPTTANRLFGRESELKLLDEAWENVDKYVLNLVAMGGMGKSALINRWIETMVKDDYCGAVHVYSWSFYSQGSAEDKQISSEPFLDDALVWFGYESETLKSSQKVQALLELIKAHKTLLILDGLEPLQYPLGGANNGMMRDRYLLELLKELSMGMDGLVLLSSRQDVAELKGKSEANVTQHPLEALSSDAGLKLFRHYDIIGSDKELKDTVEAYHGHALSLNLLARYLCDYEDRDIKKQDQLVKLTSFPEATYETAHAFRVMQGYEKKLADSTDLKILYMLGLFDRPTSKGAVDVLREAKIAGLWDETIKNRVWQVIVKRLRKQGLLNEPNTEYTNTLDTHPLIRQYFSTRFKTLYPEAWKASHLALYHYYKELPKKTQPDTLEEIQPLFAAVMHGCAADEHEEVLVDVYYGRIKRKDNYLMEQLGATASDLSVIAYFFDHSSGEHWLKPVENLSNTAKKALLNWAGFRLRALGRLHEASLAMHSGLELEIEEKNWEGAVDEIGNISELQALRGLLLKAPEGEQYALEAGYKAIEYIDSVEGSSDRKLFRQMLYKAKLANIYHMLAKVPEAQQSFEEAERRQKELQPVYPKLYSRQGFLYCDFLLSQGNCMEVLERATDAFVLSTANKWLLDIALDKLSLGRAKMQEGLGLLVDCIDPTGYRYIHVSSIQSNVEIWKTSKQYLDESVEELREAQNEDYLLLPLLARAMHSRFTGATDEAIRDLQEVYEMSTRAGMRLFLCDCHLESARLACTIGDKVLGLSVKEHYVKAKEIVDTTGYERRRAELEFLESMV